MQKLVKLVLLFLIFISNINIQSFAATGPDVASWQHPDGRNINWLEVRLAGNEFAFVKATEGLDYINPYYVDDSIAIKTVGMLRGAYHFARPKLSPELQAAFFGSVALGGRLPGDFAPVLDIEDTGGLNPTQLVDWTKRFISVLEKISGRKPIIYTSPNFWKTALGNTTIFNKYPLWLAQYNNKSTPTYPLPGGWKDWTFWQYTSSARIPGILGGVDHSAFNGKFGTPTSFAFNLSSANPLASTSK